MEKKYETICDLPDCYRRFSNEQLIISNVELFDIYGKLLLSLQSSLSPEITTVGERSRTIDISHFANGMYFLKVNGKVFKILKQ